eukprot:gene38550-47606_t
MDLAVNVEENLLRLERDPENKETLNAVFRAFHTIKGGAGFMSLGALVSACHLTENLFDALRTGAAPVTPIAIEAALMASGFVADQLTELNNGAKVFRRLLEQNAQSLRFGARLLARDTAFVAAIGNNDESDRATIESALANSGRRIKATASMLVSAERKITATTSEAQSAGLEKLVMSMLDQAEASDGANGIAVVDRYPYQVVVMPVKAPIVIGYIVMTFPIDSQLAAEMQSVTGLHTSILTRDRQGGLLPVASTFGVPVISGLVQQLRAAPPRADAPFDADVQGARYSVRQLLLGEDAGQAVSVLLARSIDEAISEYARLERWLLGLAIAGIVISAAVSVFTAKRIAQPLTLLADTAKRLERGDYKGQIEFKREDEIGALAQAFDSMRDGIAKREQEIRRLAYWDTLTGLPNRAQFVLHLNDSIAEARKRESSAQLIAHEILAALETPLSLEDQMVDIGAGLGTLDGDSRLLMRAVANLLGNAA